MKAFEAQHYLVEVALRHPEQVDKSGYPFNIPAIAALDTLVFHPKVTFFVGENGAGKSTLIEAIAICCGFNPEGGTRNFNFGTRASHSVLHRNLRLVRSPRRPRDGFFLRAESYFNVATNIEQLDAEPGPGAPILPGFGGVSLHEQSHGESFFALLEHRFGGHGLYILDEPEAALSPTRQLSFLARMHELIGQGSQFIIATHSPIILAYPDADIYVLDQTGIGRTRYEDTEHYDVTRNFLNHREVFLKTLLETE